MNDLVYPVHGGMEDWAYGGSWDTDLVKPCNPTTFGGYPESKTIYDNSTLRAFNFLIETSDNKNPLPTVLGTDEDLFGATAGEGNGHISRKCVFFIFITVHCFVLSLFFVFVKISSVSDLL